MKLRAAVIGAGVMGLRHARVLNTLEGVELVGVVDPALILRETTYSDFQCFGNLQDVLEEGIDYAIVSTPTSSHESVASQLAAARVAALIEKPLARTSDEAERIVQAFENAEVVGAVGHIERFNSASREAQRRIAQGQLGELRCVLTRRQGPYPKRISDVGVVFDLVTHDVDLSQWLTSRDYVSLSAQEIPILGGDHEDAVVVCGKMAGNLLFSNIANWVTPFKERSMVVVGDQGAFVLDLLNADLSFYANVNEVAQWEAIASVRGAPVGDVTHYAFDRLEPLVLEHQAFRDAVSARQVTCIASLDEGARVVRIAEAIKVSAQRGSTMTVTNGGGIWSEGSSM